MEKKKLVETEHLRIEQLGDNQDEMIVSIVDIKDVILQATEGGTSLQFKISTKEVEKLVYLWIRNTSGFN